MASSLVITCKLDDTQARALQFYQVSGKPKEQATALRQLFKDLAGGKVAGTVDVQSAAAAPVAAAATATLVSCATDTITIGSITFTGTGTPTTSLHFETDGDNTADAAALAAAINAHATTSLIVTATSAENVVTVTAKQKGVVGNFIPFSETGSTITCTGSGFLAGGTGGATDAAVSNTFGL